MGTVRSALAVGVLTGVVLALVPSASVADCCLGPPVFVGLHHRAPLTRTLQVSVVNDEPDHAYRATSRCPRRSAAPPPAGAPGRITATRR